MNILMGLDEEIVKEMWRIGYFIGDACQVDHDIMRIFKGNGFAVTTELSEWILMV